MTRRFVALVVVALLSSAAGAIAPAATEKRETASAEAQPAEAQPAEAPFVFEQYQLVLLKRPAAAPDYPPERLQEIQRGHLAHMSALGKQGKLVIAGPFSDQEDESLRGLALYQVGSVDEARALAAADPAVVAGRLEIEVVTWHVEEGYMIFPRRPRPAEPAEDPAADAAAEAAGEPPPGASR